MTADDLDDGISLKPLADTLSRYRRVLSKTILAVAAVGGVVLVAAFFLLPVERLGSIQFRLMFDGAADNKYPNGLLFSTTEIVGTSVLTEVFRQNDLGRFGQYRDFRDSIFVLQSSQ